MSSEKDAMMVKATKKNMTQIEMNKMIPLEGIKNKWMKSDYSGLLGFIFTAVRQNGTKKQDGIVKDEGHVCHLNALLLSAPLGRLILIFPAVKV